MQLNQLAVKEESTKNPKTLLDLPIKETEIESFTPHHLEDLNTKLKFL